jgi:hypothetical protein
MKRLAEIVPDRRPLWNMVHTEVQASLKVTLEQSREIANQFFTPVQIFEFGLDSFLASSLCDLDAAKTDEAMVDVFYAVAGYVHACRLPSDYDVKAKPLVDFVIKMLITYGSFEKFDAHKFVWVVESVGQHLGFSEATFRNVCESVLQTFSDKSTARSGHPIARLHQMCLISTSPSLQQLPMLKQTINCVFSQVVEEQHYFTHRYIFGCFVRCLWEGEATGCLSDPLRAWKLYLVHMVDEIKRSPGLSDLIVLYLIEDSLSYFIGYYGEVQPSLSRSKDLRRDLFEIVSLCVRYHPGKIGQDTCKKMWYLLYIVAVSGADPSEFTDIMPQDCKEADSAYLGLSHDGVDFDDYGMALARLGKKFEAEAAAFPSMVEFIRKNYSPSNLAE